jgi:hypothetical protein
MSLCRTVWHHPPFRIPARGFQLVNGQEDSAATGSRLADKRRNMLDHLVALARLRRIVLRM